MVKKSVLFSSTKSLTLFYVMYGSLKSPSYFAGDMRKLKVVSKQTLLGRANPNLGIDFFNSTRHALITSIKGKFAEAHRMSGGDYDGDRAWLSWNSDLIGCLPDSNMFVAEDTSNLIPATSSDLENKLFSECSMNDIMDYMIHFRYHHVKLGRLSESLDFYIDKYGFDNLCSKEIGRAAYLQVRKIYV